MFVGRFLEIMKARKEARKKKVDCWESAIMIKEDYVLKPGEQEELEAMIKSIRASEE